MPLSLPLLHPSSAASLPPESQGVAVGLSPQTRELLAMSAMPVSGGLAAPAAFSLDDSLDEDLIHNATSSFEAVSKELAVLNSRASGSPDFIVPPAPKVPPEKPPIQAAADDKKSFPKPSSSPAPTPAGGSLQSPLNFLAEQALALGQTPPEKKADSSGHKELSCQPPSSKLLEAHLPKQKHHGLPRPAHGPQAPTPLPAPQAKVFPVGGQQPKSFPPSPPFAKLQGPKAASPLPPRSLPQQPAKAPTKAPGFHSAASSLSPAPGSSHKTSTSPSAALSYVGKHPGSSNAAGQPFKSPFVALSRHVASSGSSVPGLSASQSCASSSGSLLLGTPVLPPGQAPSRSAPSAVVKKTLVSQKLTLVAPPGGPNVGSSGGTQGVAKLLTSSLKPAVVSSSATTSTSGPVSGCSAKLLGQGVGQAPFPGQRGREGGGGGLPWQPRGQPCSLGRLEGACLLHCHGRRRRAVGASLPRASSPGSSPGPGGSRGSGLGAEPLATHGRGAGAAASVAVCGQFKVWPLLLPL